jgi:hypothetical protein
VGDKISLHDEYASFQCPGCKTTHTVAIKNWNWNGSATSPTFNPSILVQCGHYGNPQSDHCWCTYNAAHPDEPAPFKCQRCHSYVQNGKIIFLPDCTHELKGQTVELPEWNSDF